MLKPWNGSNTNDNFNNQGNGSGSNSPLRVTNSMYSKEKDNNVGIVNIFYPLSDRTSKNNKTDNNIESLGGIVGSSSSVSGAGIDHFISHELSTQSIVSSSHESNNKDSLFSKSKKLADGKKKKVTTGSSVVKVNGKKVSNDSLMINGTTNTSISDNVKSVLLPTEITTTVAGASVDFEIMDSPRNTNIRTMKGSTIVKSDYVDSTVNNTTSEFGSLNNINLVKAQAPATTFGLPKVSQAQVKQ